MNRWLMQTKPQWEGPACPQEELKYVWFTPNPGEDENESEPCRAGWDVKRCCHRGKLGSISYWVQECLHFNEANLLWGASQRERERYVHMQLSAVIAALLYRKNSEQPTQTNAVGKAMVCAHRATSSAAQGKPQTLSTVKFCKTC